MAYDAQHELQGANIRHIFICDRNTLRLKVPQTTRVDPSAQR